MLADDTYGFPFKPFSFTADAWLFGERFPLGETFVDLFGGDVLGHQDRADAGYAELFKEFLLG